MSINFYTTARELQLFMCKMGKACILKVMKIEIVISGKLAFFLVDLSDQVIILTEFLWAIHSIRILKRCVDCLRLKLKAF